MTSTDVIILIIIGMIIFSIIYLNYFKNRKEKGKGCTSCPYNNNCKKNTNSCDQNKKELTV